MDREVQERHRRRWMDEGTSDSEYALNQSIEGFNELVDNMLAPTVHRVRCSRPLNNDINILGVENVVISDLTRNEAVKDEKLLHTKLESIIIRQRMVMHIYIWITLRFSVELIWNIIISLMIQKHLH
jgi:hypothetical protein